MAVVAATRRLPVVPEASAKARHPAKRRRLRTALQELIHVAARFIATGRRLKPAFGHACPIVAVFRRLSDP